MNYIDSRFKQLVNHLKKKTKEEIYGDMVYQYKRLNQTLKNSFEDYFVKFPYWGTLSERKEDFGHMKEIADSLKDHLDDFVHLYSKLGDYRSKLVLYGIMSNWYQYDFDYLNRSIEKNYGHYFDLDLIEPEEDELIVDLGAYTGDTILDYIYTYGENSYKKIYAFDITEESLIKLRENTSRYPNIIAKKRSISDKSGITYVRKSEVDNSANTTVDYGEMEVLETTLDEEVKEKITILKMDIEGGEQKALRGATEHIKNDHPKLLISVYHNVRDIFEIPNMIEQIDSSYQFYLRNYGGGVYPTEIVLIAI